MLEFAITSFLFLTLIIVTMESAVAGFRAVTIQFIASEGVRQGILGVQSVADIKNTVLGLGQGYGLPLRVEDLQVCTIYQLNDDGTCSAQTTGASNDFLVVRVESTTPYFLGMMTIDLLGEAIARNERK